MPSQPLILAAGHGTRMRSNLPKVLHLLGGKPMLHWSIDAARKASGVDPVVVVGPGAEDVRQAAGKGIGFVEQEDRLGTGHAVSQAEAALKGKSRFLVIINADLPLIRPESIRKLIDLQESGETPLALITAISDDPRGFGRILRDENNRISGILEEAHATPEQKAIRELNYGAYCVRDDWLWERLHQLPLSPKGEYYLTDLVAIAVHEGYLVPSVQIETEDEMIGINTRVHLAEAEAALRLRTNQHWMENGVTLTDPAATYIGPDVIIGMDSVIEPNTTLEGNTVIGEGCRVGPNSIVRESKIGDRSVVLFSVLEGALLEEDVDVGPFARLRKGAHLCRGAHMGNFGEVKNSTIGPGSKLGHFSYVGDTTMGENVNIGAGTITCNYDGENKHPTIIGDQVFIGSDTMLVAPVTIGPRSRTGAGSVVTKDVSEDTLVVGHPARAIRKLKQRD
jgi:bifunctional UDP-N-acetylglucosamine pyrophosphorylase / glucosamine-1-phosphate N-acetyltransferase